MRIMPCEQNTPRWLQIRAGRITASRMADVVAKRVRGAGELACRRNYRWELICERLTHRCADHYVSAAMERGSEMEPYARAAYEVATGADLEQVGFGLHPLMDFSGASPDSLIIPDGGLEIKAPETATHLEWMIAGVVPEEHKPQLLWNMVCFERDWWEFLSFDDRLPVGMRAFICRMERDEKRIAEMEYEAMQFNYEIEQVCKKLGAPPWTPPMPAVRSTETERIGALDVPEDISEFLDQEAIDLRMTP